MFYGERFWPKIALGEQVTSEFPTIPENQTDGGTRDAAGIDTATNRRRAGRLDDVRPELVPILRGEFDSDAPADPDVGRPGGPLVDRDLLLGIVVALGLVGVGAVIWFVA